MNFEKFKKKMEDPIYRDLSELYSAAQLNSEEIGVFNKYEHVCKHWLLRSKKVFTWSINNSSNFIQNLARLLLKLQSNQVTGPKDHLVKEMFGDKNIHRCFETKNGVRSTISSNKIFNTIFELKIMSFLLDNDFNIELCKSVTEGHKIPEFIAIKDSLRINVEAKNLDIDKIMDNVLGDAFINGIDYIPTEKDREKGYLKIQSRVEDNYNNALQKFFHIPSNEYFILFLNMGELSIAGKATIDYLNNLSNEWVNSKYNNLIGVVLPQHGKTSFIENKNCDVNIRNHINNFLEFHNYVPSTV